MVYAASIHTELFSCGFDIVFNVFPSHIYVVATIYVFQTANLFEILI
jgi:hypothetical protein